MEIREQDVQTLRKLAAEYMEIASLPSMKETIRLWYALNEHRMEKPMVTIEQICWNELEDDPALRCTVEEPYFRGIEQELRQKLYKYRHMPVDMAFDPYIVLPRAVTDTGYGLETVHAEERPGAESFLFVDQLAEEEDLEKLHVPKLTLDAAREAEILEIAHRIFDGIAPVRFGGVQLHAGIWDFISFWKGVEQCYMDLIERPELMHAIMERITNGMLAWIDQVNGLGIYDISTHMTHCSYTYDSRLPGADCDAAHPTTKGGWCYSMAQLFTSVSPKTNIEFELPYLSRIFERFGSVYYGCCERLDDRLDIVTRMPNIRKISCSPWSDRKHFAETLDGSRFILSNKPTPAYLAGDSFDEEIVRRDLRHTMELAKANGLCVEFLLKDISTVRNDPARLWRWAEIAREETANW